jgi:lipoprotein
MLKRVNNMVKVVWNLILFIACLLFFLGLKTDNIVMLVSSMALGMIVRLFGFEFISIKK